MQINYNDVNQLDANKKLDYEKTFTHLQTILGSDLVNYLIAQAALDSSLQSATITDVIKTMNADGSKLVVYDRRFNDQLGSQ
jgi:hypothetical protein